MAHYGRQHEPVTTPNRWGDEERRFARQVDHLFDEVYQKLGKQRDRIAELEGRGEEEEGAEAETAKKLSTARQIALTGEASGQTLFDGSEDVSIYTHVERITNSELEELVQ